MLRPDGEAPGRENVRPGLHDLGPADAPYAVVWWDPARLTLEVEPLLGLRRHDLLKEVSGAKVST